MGTRARDLPPRAGWLWLHKGWNLFRKNPSGLLVLLASYLGTLFFLSALLREAGVALALLLNPGLSAGLMTGCRLIDRGLPVTPGVIFSPFLEENRRLAKPFFRLGLWYAICGIAITVLTNSLTGSVDTTLIAKGEPIPPEMAEQVLNGVVLSSLLFMPVAMLFWYAPALVLWHDIQPGKALFFSLVTVWRNKGAFLIYGMGWLLWTMASLSILSVVTLLLGLPSAIVTALVFVAFIAIMAISTATVYPSYMDVFESDESAETDTRV